MPVVKAVSAADAARPAGEDSAGKRYEAANRLKAARIAASLDDRLLAAQVICGGIDGSGPLGADMRAILEECPPGGILLFRYNLNAEKDHVRAFLAECTALVAAASGLPHDPAAVENNAAPETGEAAEAVPIPPLIAVDHEGGAVFRFGPGVARLPAAGAYGELAREQGRETALALVEEDARRSAQEIRDLGITLNLAPLAEPLTPGNRAFLEDRSYGDDVVFVEAAAAAFIRGMAAGGIGCAVKHFPGTAGLDPHLAPSTLAGDRESLAVLTRPFANLIRAGMVSALMVSHSRVPARDGENIASLSAAVIGDWLRGELGFTGLVIADDFSMAAASAAGLSPEAAALRSLAAGADMVIVWPGNIRRTHRALLTALGNGSLPRERLREAAERIIGEKIRRGIIAGG
ncbi:MAG: glycoside hydrolase family 3 protein [Treponema sp.]|jgi:beta-N-acetylhexosaminidase|nr:glycoside hydrolase family 3 protein [Treponema sp.]